MPGPPTFVIPEVTPAAQTPQTWSFSGLHDFEECPRRWALARTPLDKFKGPLPYKPTKSAVEGTLLHSLVEEYVTHLFEFRAEPFRPRRVLLALLETWAKQNEGNPRINSRSLASQIPIEEILRAFVQAKNNIRVPTQKHTAAPHSTGHSNQQSGAEVPLFDPESKLRGRADLITDGQILDFKTGEPKPEHAEQLVFYASLFLATNGRAPRALTLLYTVNGQEVTLPVPPTQELTAIVNQARRRVSDAEAKLAANDLPARPEATKCSRCHVRGLCGPYWANRADVPIDSTQPPIMDYSPSLSASVDRSSQGMYIRDTIKGLNSTLYIPQEITAKVGSNIQAMKALALRATPEASGVRLAFTQFSEIFVTDGASGSVA